MAKKPLYKKGTKVIIDGNGNYEYDGLEAIILETYDASNGVERRYRVQIPSLIKSVHEGKRYFSHEELIPIMSASEKSIEDEERNITI